MTTAYQWTPVIIVHAALAVASVGIGAVLLSGRKGTVPHRVLGWIWVLMMAGVAGVSFAIHREHYSWIHGLSVFTLIMLVVGVSHARRHRRAAHQWTMTSMYIGALIITGLFTLLPGRLIGSALWGLFA